jgi:hypothetical protein
MAGSITIEDVYQELKTIERTMVTREDLDALIDSVEILSNPKTMAALHKSDLDIKEGRDEAVFNSIAGYVTHQRREINI